MYISFIKHYTFLGLLLSISSSLVAKFYSKNPANPQSNSYNNAALLLLSGGDNAILQIISCRNPAGPLRCHYTEITGTTNIGKWGTLVQSTGGKIYETQSNTSNSITSDTADSTSILVRVG